MSPPHVAFEMQEQSQVGEVRRAAVRLAEGLGFDEVAAGRVALIATELGGNLVRHAQQGRVLLGSVDGQVELLSLDRGPGMADVAACLRDGYSTGGTPGTGLGAVRRLADTFDLYSSVPAGTVILARVGPVPTAGAELFSIGAVALCAPGETVCGDGWAAVQDEARAALVVADGLGHGPQAAEAAEAATAAFAEAPFQDLGLVLERVHQRLRGTRGAAVTVVTLDREGLSFCGAGNVLGRLVSGNDERTLLSQNGTAGLQIRRPQPVRHPWPPHALLVMHSDGVHSRWHLDDARGLLQRHPSLVAAWLLRDHARGRDDATVVVIKRNF